MADCPASEQLLALLEERLSPAEQDRLNLHLVDCGDCQLALDRLSNRFDSASWSLLLRADATHASMPVPERQSEAFFALLKQWLPEQMSAVPTRLVAAPTERDVPVRVGPYQVLRRLGRGGMGVVYLAEDERLQRLVAIKMIHSAANASRQLHERSRSEAETVARLRHPNIVPIYEVGEQDGQPYLVLEFVSGGTLADLIKSKPQAPRDAASILQTLARAIHYAHQHGIVHRDLKPTNILWERQALPGPLASVAGEDAAVKAGTAFSECRFKISDFGLAKRADDPRQLTQTDALLGTPCYMAPEQALGRAEQVGPAADVHALGAILYELLTGRPPFDAESILATLELVRSEEPVPPRRLQPRLPRDLETICLKCLEKEPAKRYLSAEALADDLQRFLSGVPIRARPVGVVEQTMKWARRYPLVASAGGIVAAAVLAVVLVVLAYGVQLQQERDHAHEEENRAAMERNAAIRARVDAQAAQRLTESAVVDLYTVLGYGMESRGELPQAALWFAAAGQRVGDDPERAGLLLTRWRSYTGASPVPWRAVRLPPGESPRHMAFHPSRRWLWTSSAKNCFLWDLEKEQPASWPGPLRGVTVAAWSPDGQLLATGTDRGRVDLFHFPDGKASNHWQLSGRVSALAFDAQGKQLAFASDRLRVWDLTQDCFVTPELPHAEQIMTVAFDATGKRIATTSRDHRVRVFAVGSEVMRAEPLIGPVLHGYGNHLLDGPPAFLAGEGGVLTSSREGIVLHSWASEQKPRTLENMGTLPYVWASPNGRQVLTHRMDAPLKLWDVGIQHMLPFQTGKALETYGAVFSPDGSRVLTIASHNVFVLSTDGSATSPALIHSSRPVALAFTADSKNFATAQEDGLVRVWQIGPTEPLRRRLPFPRETSRGGNFFALSSDGRSFLAADPNAPPTCVRCYRVSDGDAVGPAVNLGARPAEGSLSPDGLAAFAVTRTEGKGSLHGWRCPTGERLFDPIELPFEPAGPTCSPDGRTLVVVGLNGRVEIRDAGSGALRTWFDAGGQAAMTSYPPGRVRFAPDGRTFVTFGLSGGARLWNAANGQLVTKLEDTLLCYDAQFTPDGRWLATAAADWCVRVWDVATGRRAGEPLAHTDVVFTARFDREGERLVTSCRDGKVRVWNRRTGKLAVPPLEHGAEVTDAAFSSDGRRVATAAQTGMARLWDAASGAPLTPPWSIFDSIRDTMPFYANRVAFSPDDQQLLVAVRMKHVNLFDLTGLNAPAPLSADDCLLLAELNAGATVLSSRGVVYLTTDEWLDRWHRFRQKHPTFHGANPATILFK